jgi:uncharacterized membrane protein
MTQSRRRALWTLGIWGVVAIGFLAAFFTGSGPAGYADDRARQVVGAVFLAIGFLGTPLMMSLTRARPGNEHVVHDERDESLGRRAAVWGLVVVILYVFVSCIVLWERHRDPGCVPVGWMWFLAYSTATLAYMVPAFVSLVLDSRGGLRAEG